MNARRIALLSLTGLALLAAAATCAQERRDAPWPSEAFNPKPKQNTAGKFDYYTLVMSWSPTHCVTAQEGRDEQQCARQDGRRYGFVLHGLWPQLARRLPEACIGRKPWVPQPVINSMLDIMPSGGLVIHEFKLHGTCSGLEPADYCKLSRQLFTRVCIPERFQNPYETVYRPAPNWSANSMRANPWLRPEMVAVTCGGRQQAALTSAFA
jgi:ribonuclease T2